MCELWTDNMQVLVNTYHEIMNLIDTNLKLWLSKNNTKLNFDFIFLDRLMIFRQTNSF